MTTFAEFNAAAGIEIRTVRVGEAIEENMKGMTEYRVTLTRPGKGPRDPMAFPYFMGKAHTRGPKLADVLESLASDVSALHMPFDEWAAEFGYDEDSRKAERLYHKCRELAAKLREFLGPGLYRDLVNVEW